MAYNISTCGECFIALGKYGDILNILPILQLKWMSSGEPQNLMVSKRYADVARGLHFVNVIDFDGEFDDLATAIRQAKAIFKKVTPLQVYGKDFPFQHRHHSFAIDQWERAGMALLWGCSRLDLESSSFSPVDIGIDGPYILFADAGESAPIKFADRLFDKLVAAFPNRIVVRMSKLKAKNIRDFVPIYDRASLLVTVDTAHLHLSSASSCPVIALSRDDPSPWHGTAQRPGLAFHCRYSEYEFREDELLVAASRVINKTPLPSISFLKFSNKHAYNPSSLEVGGSMVHSARYHPDPKSWKTKISMLDSSGCSDLAVPAEIAGYSIEDGRLFNLNGKPHLCYTLGDSVGHSFRSIMAYGPISKSETGWVLESHIQPEVAKNDFSSMQKNWMPFSVGGRLYFIYGVEGANQIVIGVDGKTVFATYKSPAPEWKWGAIRGGCMVAGGAGLRMFHSRVGDGHKHLKFRYHIGATKMKMEPPFETVSVSNAPVIAGHEEWFPNCNHWKPNCALPYGAWMEGDRVAVSYGVNDCRSAVARIPKECLNL